MHGNVGNKRHFILIAISKVLGDYAKNCQIPDGTFSDETCYTARDIVDNVISKERIMKDLGDQNLQVRSSLPGAIHKVGQKAKVHGRAACNHAVYGLDGQCPAATTLGAGRGVLPSWSHGDTIDTSFRFNSEDTSRARGFPDDYIPFLKQFDSSEEFIIKCLGNAATQGFMLAIDRSVHDLLQSAGVSHDIYATAHATEQGKVLHTCVHPILPSLICEEQCIMNACHAAIDTDRAIHLVFDTGAQAFFLPDTFNDCFVNGGRKSPAVIMAAKSDTVMQASRTGRFRWMTSGQGNKGKQYKQFIVDMPDGAVHTVRENELCEGLAGFEPLYKMHFSLVMNSEEEGGEAYAWRRIRSGSKEEFQYIPIVRDNERCRHCILVSPVKSDNELNCLMAEMDSLEVTDSKSVENVALRCIHEMEHDEADAFLDDLVKADGYDHYTTHEPQHDELDEDSVPGSVWLHACSMNIEDTLMQINKSFKKGIPISVEDAGKDSLSSTGDQLEVVNARTPHDKNVLGAKDVLRERRMRNLTEKEFLKRISHVGCCDPSCVICNTVIGPIRQFKLKVNPYRETRPGFVFTLDMIQLDTRAVDGSLYVPQLRCEACHFMPEVTLILKDDWYPKFRALVTRWRKCGVYSQHGYKVISVIKADNDSVWDNENTEWLKIRTEFEIEMRYPPKSDDRDAAGAEATCRIVEYGIKRGLCVANAHPKFWNWHYKFFLWVANRLATTSNSAIRSPDGNQ